MHTSSQMLSRRSFQLFLLALFSFSSAQAQQVLTDIPYAEGPTGPLLLDLHMPAEENPPLIVWIHGGAWRFGNKGNPLALPIVGEGFALASVEFRPANEAPFPEQLHDIRAAIRFLRAQAGQYGYRADKIAIWGHSSGGHLAAMIGTTNDMPDLHGTLGAHLDQDASVQAVIDASGPANLNTILHQSTPAGLNQRTPALEILLSGGMEDEGVAERATIASPVSHASAGDAPLLLMHGMQDNIVPINQALELELAYRMQGLAVKAFWLRDAQHGSRDYFNMPYLEDITAFLHEHLD